MYSLGEAVLCSQGVLIYEAKIQDIKKEKGETLYGVHYKGWNKSWDEYVTDARLMKINEENLMKQKELQEAVKKKKPAATVVKKVVKKTESETSREGSKDNETAAATKNVNVRIEKLKKDSESGDYVGVKEEEKPVISSRTRTIKPVIAFKATEVPKSMKKKLKNEKDLISAPTKSKPDKSSDDLPPVVKRRRDFGQEIVIHLTDELKTILVDDFDYIDRQRKLVNIPSRYSVDDLINDYCAHVKQSKEDNDAEDMITSVSDVCRGLRDYFNCTLGSQLLYKFERVQYADILKEQPGEVMSQLYSPVHLLRLFTKLGPMLCCVDISDEDIELLVNDIGLIVKYIDANRDSIFLTEDYGTASPEYHRRAL